MTKANNLTPMMRQYLEMKKAAPGAILFFRLGDFYEMFDEDAIQISKELDLTLTHRSDTPMCGVPYHAAETYLDKLMQKGYKVAICEQIGNPKAKGLTKREIIKILTPGTVLTDSALPGTQNNYIVLLHGTDTQIALVGADVSTGECFYAVYARQAENALFDELYRLLPREILVTEPLSHFTPLFDFWQQRLTKTVLNTVGVISASPYLNKHFASTELPQEVVGREALATFLQYLHDNMKSDLANLNRLRRLDASRHMAVDVFSLRNLEITHNLRDGGKKDTLFSILDFTRTAMGSRLLCKWLEYPLLSKEEIVRRQEAIKNFQADYSMLENVQNILREIYDFERLLTRVDVGTANPRDMLAIRKSLAVLPNLKGALQGAKAPLLKQLHGEIKIYRELTSYLEKALSDNAGFLLRDGNIIKDGFNQELDDYRYLLKNNRTLLQEMEKREREATGIKSLKISYNKVFGYYIEVRNANLAQVPIHYTRKQTLANAERYITPELKEFETKILGAEEKVLQLETNLFWEIRSAVQKELVGIQETAQAIATVDVLAALTEAALQYGYVCPSLTDTGEIRIKEGRHPLVERLLEKELFVPNDSYLDAGENRILLITGPNMAGKSTYMRQTALIVLLAQVGSFVPCDEAVITPVDKLFTRIGASDDLSSGQSTFMVEMNEVAYILQNATAHSLVILDEIGRGTSTFDGMSIARAVVEYLAEDIKAKTLFATHYHELTTLEREKGIKNYCVAVEEKGREVRFLRRIIQGSADKSYGVHVAKLAGLPEKVLVNAERILADLEKNGGEKVEKKGLVEMPVLPFAEFVSENNPTTIETQIPVGENREKTVPQVEKPWAEEEILAQDIVSMTPLEALNYLYKLQKKVKERRKNGE